MQVAVVVGVGDVAGGEPTVRSRAVATVGPVAGEQVRPAHRDLTGLVVLDRFTVGVPQHQLHARHRPAHRARLAQPADQGAGQHRRGLGQAVAFVNGDAGIGVTAQQCRRQRRRAGQRQPDVAEPGGQLGLAGPGQVHGWGGGHVGDRLPFHQLQRLGRVKALDQHAGRAGPRHHPQRRVQPVDVEERQRQQHDVVRHDRRRLDSGALLQVRQQCPVAEHRAPGAPAGPAGVEEHGRVLPARAAVRYPVRGRREQVRQGRGRVRTRRGRHHDVLQRWQLRPQRGGGLDGRDRGGDQRPGARVGQQLAQLGDRVAGVGRHRDEAGLQRSEVNNRKVQGIAELDRHPVPCGQAQTRLTRTRLTRTRLTSGGQRGRRPLRGRRELTPGQPCRTGDQRGAAGRGGGRPPEQFGQVTHDASVLPHTRPAGADGRTPPGQVSRSLLRRAYSRPYCRVGSSAVLTLGSHGITDAPGRGGRPVGPCLPGAAGPAGRRPP